MLIFQATSTDPGGRDLGGDEDFGDGSGRTRGEPGILPELFSIHEVLIRNSQMNLHHSMYFLVSAKMPFLI